jgi:hypothetical protein
MIWRILHFIGIHKWNYLTIAGKDGMRKLRKCDICGRLQVYHESYEEDWLDWD